MEKQFKRTLITTALPYANGPVHIGHLAGVYVPADIYARYLRLKGEEVLMIGGSDEHGVPITLRAKKEGITPQDVVDRYHGIIKKSFEEFGITFDIYSRTTSATHHQMASDFFRTLYDKGEYEIVSAFTTKVGASNEFKYYDYADIESEERFNEYVTQAKSRSFYDTGVNTVYGDSLITLSTCAYHTSNERFVVIARKK